MLAWEPFVPAVMAAQVRPVTVAGTVSATRVPGVSVYTVTAWLAVEAMATMRPRAVPLRLRLIAAARLVALLAAPAAPAAVDTSKSVPVLVVVLAVKLRETAVPPVGVTVNFTVPVPATATVLKVPTTFARVFPVDALTGNTTKSAVQLGVAFTLKEYLAGHIPCATPPAPSEMAQSFFMGALECIGGTLGRLGTRPERARPRRTSSGRTRPEPAAA